MYVIWNQNTVYFLNLVHVSKANILNFTLKVICIIHLQMRTSLLYKGIS